MSKSTIIIADTDEKFLASLELQFIEELDESFDLELITDPVYFEEHFSKPQSASIIIVSEDLFNLELKKHNINKFFVLSESNDESTENLDVEKIFKYTSPKEIYKQVMSKSGMSNKTSGPKETVVALVYSAAGGVGKTTVALGISNALAKSFNRVLYINAERVNSFQSKMTNTTTIPNSTLSDFADMSSSIFNRISHVIRNEVFDYIPPFGMAIASLGIDFSVYTELIKSAKASKKYDIIVVDTDSTFDKDKADLLTLADKVLMITEQTQNSVFATNTLIKNISCNDNSKYYFICNKFNESKSNSLISSTMDNKFVVNEYIRNFDNYDSMSVADISQQPDIQKVSYLIV